MTLTADRETKRSDALLAVSTAKASTALYGGTLCNRLSSDGKVQPGADTASTTFGGVVKEFHAATSTRKVVTYRTGEFEFKFGAGSATDALIGSEVCINGEDTVDAAGTTTNDIKCGIIAAVPSSTTVRVVIDGYVK